MFRRVQWSCMGFTLIEVMIIVVIVGVLAVLAIPRFMQSATKSKQSEAKQILKQIYTSQQAYRQKHFTYWNAQGAVAGSNTPNAFAELGVEISSTARYSYSFDILTKDTFQATASIPTPGLDSDPTPDVWSIDHNGFLVSVSDDSVL